MWVREVVRVRGWVRRRVRGGVWRGVRGWRWRRLVLVLAKMVVMKVMEVMMMKVLVVQVLLLQLLVLHQQLLVLMLLMLLKKRESLLCGLPSDEFAASLLLRQVWALSHECTALLLSFALALLLLVSQAWH